jgi:Zn finger protein HypA/HybF involved in hydrogenase expression
MPNKRKELEQQLRAKAEKAIRNLLEKLPDKSELTMTDIENLVGEMGQEVTQSATEAIAQGEQIEPSEVMCERCHVRMQKRGKRKKRVVTKRGEIELERQYYVCPQCGEGIFPPR